MSHTVDSHPPLAERDAIARAGMVIFVRDVVRVARFYEMLVPMRVVHSSEGLVVLESGPMQLVVHAIPHPPEERSTAPHAPAAREDSYIKPFFRVASLAAVREAIEPLGGRLFGPDREFTARDFHACDGIDPEGNVVQFREALDTPP